jgi:hypothetical protein
MVDFPNILCEIPLVVHEAEDDITKLMSENIFCCLSSKFSLMNGLSTFSLWEAIMAINFLAVRCSFTVMLKHKCC